MTTSSTIEVAHGAGVHRYATEHWQLLRPFIEGRDQDPKGLFYLTDDTWDLWPYSKHAIASYALRYRLKFDGLRSFIKPFVKWYCYQQILQCPGDLNTSEMQLPYNLKRTDSYLTERGYSSLDDLAPLSAFEELWAGLLPQKSKPYSSHDVRLQTATRAFWQEISALFGVPLLVPPIAPHVRHRYAEAGLDESALIPDTVIAQLMNKLGLYRDGISLLNRFHHLRLCVLLLNICLGRRISEVLLAPRCEGPDGPLVTYPGRGKEGKGDVWFRFEPNKSGPRNEVYISPEWHDLVSYCVKTILFYSDEIRHLAPQGEQHLLILLSRWNLTYGGQAQNSSATEHDTDFDYRHLNKLKNERRRPTSQQTALAMTYAVFFSWLVGSKSAKSERPHPGILELWGITADGKADGEIYYMRSKQARHTRQTALAQDPTISTLTLQRDLNHNSQDTQRAYQHQLQQANEQLRKKVEQRQLHGLGTYWLEQCLGLAEPGTHPAFRPGAPAFTDPRIRSLVVNNPQFVQPNRVSCGLCALPQGPAGCQEFMNCTESTDEGCNWFLTDPSNTEMQNELRERASEHRAKQQQSAAEGKVVQAQKFGVMAERTERFCHETLQKTSEEARRALLDELNIYEEGA